TTPVTPRHRRVAGPGRPSLNRPNLIYANGRFASFRMGGCACGPALDQLHHAAALSAGVLRAPAAAPRAALGPASSRPWIGSLALDVVEIREVLAGGLLVRAQVVVAASGDPFQLRPAEGKLVLDVEGAARVVGQLLLAVLP